MVDGSRASQSMFPTRTVLPSLRLWVRSMFRSTRGVGSISLDLSSGAPGKKLPSCKNSGSIVARDCVLQGWLTGLILGRDS